MDTRARQGSNALTLIAIIQEQSGETFAKRCNAYTRGLDARIGRSTPGTPEWHDLVQQKVLVNHLKRFDSKTIVLEEQFGELTLAAVA